MSISLKPLDQQVMVITGASSGIGLATALSAAHVGAKVVLAARSEEVLQAVNQQINETGGEAIYVVADVGDAEQVQRVAEAAVNEFGRIDTWVNNAGVSIYGRLDEISEEDARRLFDTNFWGVVHGSLAALPYLKQQGGALINIGSELSDAVVPLQGMYAASKHAVEGFTEALRVELQQVDKAPVAVTLIQPTSVNTPYPQHAKNYMDQEPKVPTPQLDPQDVVNAILNAATNPKREVKVGTMSKVDTVISNLAPALFDRLAAMQTNRQQYDIAPLNPEGALYSASEDGRIRGFGSTISEN